MKKLFFTGNPGNGAVFYIRLPSQSPIARRAQKESLVLKPPFA
jgi:hypothetical protein